MEILEKICTFKVETAVIFACMLIAFLGYALGSIKIKGVSLGTAGVFLMSLLFGYLFTLPIVEKIPVVNNLFLGNASKALYETQEIFDAKLADISNALGFYGVIGDIGLVLFVTAVGFIAGPSFFKNLKKNAKSYVLLGILIVGSGALVCALFSLLYGSDYGTGIMSGALTSTPGFAAAKAAVAESQRGMVSLGHAVAYPFGVVGVVLFVQLIPKFLKADMAKERELMKAGIEAPKEENKKSRKLFEIDEFGLGVFGLAVVLGILLGSIKIPLSANGYAEGAPTFSLGNTGGPLIMALILGHFGRMGKLSLKVPDKTLKVFREFGLMIFLIGAGVDGGVELVNQIKESPYGIMLLVYGLVGGALMTIIPMFIGYFFARKVLKMSMLNTLGSITGGMTSTPALGTLINVAGTDDVAAAYASTYPVALVFVVLSSQLIAVLI